MAFWARLPSELQKEIFELMSTIPNTKSHPHPVAACASVSKEWQSYFERQTFKRLILSQGCLRDFKRITARKNYIRASYVKHVWLRVELDQNHCSACGRLGNDDSRTRNETTLSLAIWDLLAVLKLWKRDGASQEGITLELSAHSPSDCEHSYKDPCLQADYPFWIEESCVPGHARNLDENHARDESEPHGPRHQGIDGHLRTAFLTSKPSTEPIGISFEAMKERFWFLSSQNWPHEFPKVAIVTRLLFRGQWYRPIALDCLVHLAKSFTSLDHLQYEYWPSHLSPTSRWFLSLLPVSTMKSLAIFKDLNDDTPPKWIVQAMGQVDAMETFLWETGHALERISVAFVTEAQGFFGCFGPTNPRRLEIWPNLKTLALTSSLLDPDTPQGQVNGLLAAAVGAIPLMPKLECMEIWNAADGYAAVFSFVAQASDDCARIVWRSTWEGDMPLTARVIDKLRERVQEDRRLELQLEVCPLPITDGAILRHLRLRSHIGHPVTLQQMLLEGVFPPTP